MRTRRRPILAGILAIAAAGLAVTLAVPGTAFALFSDTPAATTASATAATLSAPTGFTANANQGNANQGNGGPGNGGQGSTVSLSWTAPSNLTGYTLTQSPGTLAGCSATPSATTTTCTVTGLSPNTKYTWTLTAVYNSWTSSAVTTSATISGGGHNPG